MAQKLRNSIAVVGVARTGGGDKWTTDSCIRLKSEGITCIGQSVSRVKMGGLRLGLYKIFFHVKAFMYESIIHALHSPACTAHNNAILLHVYCAIHNAPRPPSG